MSDADLGADELELPIKRTDGETLEERLTDNAYHNILPARYLRKNADGDAIESQEDLFPRVADNIALAEAVFEAEKRDTEITVTPDQLKPDHPRRDELAAEVFGAGTRADADAETTLSVYNVNKFSYDTVVPDLPEDIAAHVRETRDEFLTLMEDLSFIPNSPTLMNAGDELQQLSACFVDSPDDDITDIHQTAKEAAEVFQCLTADATVSVAGEGVVSIADVEPGDEITQRDGDGYRTRTVEEIHAYDDAPTKRVTTEGGIEITGTPNHRLLVDGEWTEIDDIEPGDTVSVRLGWIADEDETEPLTTVVGGAQWDTTRTVSNESVARLHAEGLSDYEIAEELDSSPSTIQRRRSDELGLPANGDGGRPAGRSFDESEFQRLHETGHTDAEIAEELGVHATTVRGYRAAESLATNGTAVKSVTQPTRLDADLAELLGLWIGDGSVHEDGIRFHLSRDSAVNRVDTLARSLFDTGVDHTWSDGCYEVVIHSHEIKRWWLSQFGDAKPSSAAARVPEAIWAGDHDTIHAFLRGLFSADGTLTKETHPRLYSASEALIDDVHQLLLGVGIPATTWEWDDEDRDYFTVAPTDTRGLSRFAEQVGFVDERDAEMRAGLDETDTRETTTGTLTGETTWEQTVTAVEDTGTDTVYDVTVAGNHEYVANSVVSHNSGGGMGYAFWQLRPYGDTVGSTGGIASGPVTFMRTFDQMCETIAQGGARRGAQMGVMRVSHPDVIQFIHAKNKDVSLAHTLRLNDPDDFTHTKFIDALEEARELIDDDGKVPKHLRNAVEGHLSNFNISVGVTDDFMGALYDDEEFVFTNPRTEEPHVATPETKELYERFGLGEYVEVGEVLSIPAAELWDHIVDGAYENGEPGVIYLERVNKQHSFDTEEHPDHRILATNPCVTGDTLISTESGLVTAEELYEQGTAQDVVVDGRLSEETLKEASSVYATGEKDVYELTTEEGYGLRLTADHRVMTEDGWVEAGDLGAGDTIHVQNRKGAFGQHGSAEEGRVLGWLVGDGHLKQGEERAVLNFYDEDAEVSEAFADDVNAVVREPTGTADYEVGVNEIGRSDDYRGPQAVEQRIRSTRLYEYAESAGLVDDKLSVPDAVMRGSEEMARGFLQSLFTADGSVQGNVEKGVSVRLWSTDADLLGEVQQLLLNFGIASKVYENREDAGTRELSDGRGGTAEDETKAGHELVIVKDNLERFRDEIGFLLDYKTEALDERLSDYDRGPYSESFTATVESVEADGTEQVYDLTEPDTSSFVANGLVVHNCGEQPLEEYEACNLGHINLSTLADEDAPDWRVWYDQHGDKHESFEDAVDAFLDEAIDFEAFDHRIEYGTRFLENVVTMSDFPVEKIEQKVREMRKIGLGIMGLAQLYVQLGIPYGSEEGNEVARQLMTHINHRSKWASHELAEERGSFDDWGDSKYANPTEYREWFEHHTGESADDWADGFPVRNHNTTTIAPTGCVAEDSLVSTDEGLREIGTLDGTTAEFEQWDELDVGVTTDGGTKRATAVYDNGFDAVKQLRTTGGFGVTSTFGHRFRAITEDGEYTWKEAEAFEPGDNIVLQRGTFDGGVPPALDTSERDDFHHNTNTDLTVPDRLTPELAEFLGYFMGDGYVHEDVGVKLAVESDAEQLDDYLRDLGRSVFGVEPTVEDKDTRHILSFGGRHLPRFFADNGWTKETGNEGEGAASAFVPEAVLGADEACAKAFLRGLFEADGTASRKVELSTVSETLAEQVQTLLLSLGCVFVRDELAMDERDDHFGDRPRHTVRGANKREDARFLDEIGFLTKDTDFELTAQSYKNDTYPAATVELLRAVEGYDDVSADVKKRVTQSPINGAISRKTVRDVEAQTGETVELDGRPLAQFYVAEIESVEEGKAYTKDISVPSNNTYVANGFVTHNTTSMVGNTTGGCEPIYNVAYYKNVSDDVQGDEMLVEFDDYFLRVLEANDIDVDAVKQEAQEQMANNEFDGVEGLETVPTAIGELFVVTSDLSGKEHAAVQCASQQGVDSAISKCIEEGTLVQTDQGLVPIEGFSDNDEPGTFSDVDGEYTIDGYDITAHYYAGSKPSTRIRLDSGAELVGATESHRVLTPDGWELLADLSEGDVVLGDFSVSHSDGGRRIDWDDDLKTSSNAVETPDRMSPAFAEFLGMIAADGGAYEETGRVEITTDNMPVEDRYAELCEQLFDERVSVESDDRTDDVRRVYVTSRNLARCVQSLVGGGAYEKHVPEQIVRGNAEEKLAFVRGLTLDGYNDSNGFTVYEGMSEDLAYGTAELLRSFGVPKVYEGRKWVSESDAYAHTVTVSNELQHLVTAVEPHKNPEPQFVQYKVPVASEDLSLENYETGTSAYYAARSARTRGNQYLFNETAEKLEIDHSGIAYKVTEVEDVGERELYDIEVEESHQYLVNGMISHNTCNFPNEASREDMDEVYRYIYDNGGKGVTVYRDGTRSKQVLTTRAQNTEFADETEAAEALVGQIREVFGGIEQFVDNEDVRAVVGDEIDDLLADRTGDAYAKERPRPDVLHGVTQRIDTGYGKMYVNINEDENGDAFELFATIGNSGGFTNSFTEALAKVISYALRSGVDPREIADDLQGIRSPKVAWDKGEQINSIPDAIGTAMRRYLDGEIDTDYPQQKNLTELEDTSQTDGGASVSANGTSEAADTADTADATDATDATDTADATTVADAEADEGVAPDAESEADATDELLAAGESPECPDCGSMTLYYSEGCKTCESCGWSEC
jgi:ribonucleoside-diphosphate reductase alpha chain